MADATISDLTKFEVEALKDTLSFLIFLDSFQVNNLPNIADYITSPAVKNVLTVQAFQEVVHAESYQYILEALFQPDERDEVYNRWKTDPSLSTRNRWIADIAQAFVDQPTRDNFHRVCLANYALEGLFFYSGFNLFDQLAHRGKLVPAAKIIDYIRRDEHSHLGNFVNIIKELDIEHTLILDVLCQASEIETERTVTTYGNAVEGISIKSSIQHQQWLLDDRLARIGIDKIYNVTNPYASIDVASEEGSSRENFFETTVTSYVVASSIDGWDEI
jgi:ribonucleoside-diphosphate reductase beta chain